MSLREDLIAYKERWNAVAEIEQQELRETSMAQKWQQLNAIIALAIRLAIFTPDPREEEVYLRWGILKEKEIKKKQ
jgi:hypothetical protein